MFLELVDRERGYRWFRDSCQELASGIRRKVDGFHGWARTKDARYVKDERDWNYFKRFNAFSAAISSAFFLLLPVPVPLRLPPIKTATLKCLR